MAGFGGFRVDLAGMGRYLAESPELAAACLAHAETGVQFAKSISPVGGRGDKHPGEFRESIRAVPGGNGKRVGARIVAEPLWVEFGRRRTNPYDGAHVLRRTGQMLNAPRRSA